MIGRARRAGSGMGTTTASKYDHLFDTRHLTADLKGRSVRGGAMALSSQFSRLVVQTASTAVLARLLEPGDFGLLAMVFAINAFIEIFRDMGLSAATIQNEKITHQQVSTLFWINVAVSAAIMLVTMAAAPAIAWFYDKPQLTEIARWLAVGFLLS